MRRLVPLALLALALLAGCGQKGPLYLPGDEAAAERYGPRDARQADADTPDTRSADEED
uniref:LPS translocon maturation chaperone LptM n=1 Tax=Halomonas koreensis TaxID=245385 RepID=UPI0035B5372B